MSIITGAKRVAPWVSKKMFGARFKADEAIGLEIDGEIVAGVVYEDWNGASFVCHIAADKMTPGFIGAIFHYPFVHCGAKKVIAPVPESNTESVAFVEKLGFRLEHRILDAHPDGAIRLYSIMADNRFIGGRYGKKCGIAATGT